MSNKSEKVRHILPLSGGKDSAALAVYLKDKIPELEYVFLDTGHELPETYEFLDRMRAILGIHILTLKPKRDFDFWLRIFKGCLPSPQNRWCTRQLKLAPYEHHIGNDNVRSYIALRADEDRTGYISHKPNVVPMYPFIEDSLVKQDILDILKESGLGLPGYYPWRSRSGCYFCFFQRRAEWVNLAKKHSDLFEKAALYESNHSDGRIYTWIEGKTLRDLLEERDKIIDDLQKEPKTTSKRSGAKRLFQGFPKLGFALGEKSILANGTITIESHQEHGDENSKPCLICTL